MDTKELTRRLITLLGWLCFWNDLKEQWEVYHAPNQGAEPFSPLTSLDDAWKIVEHIYENRAHGAYSVEVKFISGLKSLNLITLGAEDFAQKICELALDAYGIE